MVPDLSIVIPTYNRQRTAVEAVKSCVEIPGDLEVIVQDCSDGRELEEMLRDQVADPRIAYEHAGKRLTMTENWNAAARRIRGEYVIFIGDDDGVGRELLDVVHWARANDVDSVGFAAYRYYWPDFPGRFAGKAILYRPGGSLRRFDVEAELIRGSYSFGRRVKFLPKLYHGLVRRTVLDRLRARSGTWFDTLAPDYYIRFALASFIDTHYRIEYPVTTIGCSGPSNSARTSEGERLSEGDVQAHFDEYEGHAWPELLPAVWHSDVMLAHSMLQGLASTGRDELAGNIALATLYARCLVRQPRRTGELTHRYMRSVRTLGRSTLGSSARLAGAVVASWVRATVLRPSSFDEPNRQIVSIRPAGGILEAHIERDAYLAASGINLRRLLQEAEIAGPAALTVAAS